MTWVFAAGAISMGLAATAADGGGCVTAALLALAGLAFVFAAVWTTNGLWPRKWMVDHMPSQLYDDYRESTPDRVKHDNRLACCSRPPRE